MIGRGLGNKLFISRGLGRATDEAQRKFGGSSNRLFIKELKRDDEEIVRILTKLFLEKL